MFRLVLIIGAVLFALVTGVSACLRLLNLKSDLAVDAGYAGLVLIAAVVIAAVVRLCRKHELTKRGTFGSLILLLVVLSTSSCYKIVPPGHVGIKVSQTGGERGVSDIPAETGRVFYNPLNESILDYPTFVQRAIWTASDKEGQPGNEEIAFQSSDGLHFTGDVAVAYQLDAKLVPHFYVQFRSDDLSTFTHGFFRDAVRRAIGESAHQFSAEEINGSKQANMEKEATTLLTNSMTPFGVKIIQLAFTSPPRPPDVVKRSIEGKIAATQRAEQIENEKRQAVAEGEKTIALAEATAKANQAINASITPQLVEWKRLDIFQSKWDGHQPMVTGGAAGMILDLRPSGK